MPVLSVRLATAADRPMMERLWLMFRHDVSEFRGQLSNSDGTFRGERFQVGVVPRAQYTGSPATPRWYRLACAHRGSVHGRGRWPPALPARIHGDQPRGSRREAGQLCPGV